MMNTILFFLAIYSYYVYTKLISFIFLYTKLIFFKKKIFLYSQNVSHCKKFILELTKLKIRQNKRSIIVLKLYCIYK